MKLLILIVSFLVINLSYGTEVVRPFREMEKLAITVVKARVGEFDTIEMTTVNNVKIDLVCGDDFFHGSKIPMVRYRNYYNINVADFVINERSTCLDLKDYLISTFEGINGDETIQFVFDLKSKRVDKIIYARINPYYAGPNEIYDKVIESKRIY